MLYLEAGLYMNFCRDEGWANFLNCKFDELSKHLLKPPFLHTGVGGVSLKPKKEMYFPPRRPTEVVHGPNTVDSLC